MTLALDNKKICNHVDIRRKLQLRKPSSSPRFWLRTKLLIHRDNYVSLGQIISIYNIYYLFIINLWMTALSRSPSMQSHVVATSPSPVISIGPNRACEGERERVCSVHRLASVWTSWWCRGMWTTLLPPRGPLRSGTSARCAGTRGVISVLSPMMESRGRGERERSCEKGKQKFSGGKGVRLMLSDVAWRDRSAGPSGCLFRSSWLRVRAHKS